jgi:hypothetical protein
MTLTPEQIQRLEKLKATVGQFRAKLDSVAPITRGFISRALDEAETDIDFVLSDQP